MDAIDDCRLVVQRDGETARRGQRLCANSGHSPTAWRTGRIDLLPNKRGLYTDHGRKVKWRFLPLFETLAAKHHEDPANNPQAPVRFNWHALRHFAVSCRIEAGLSPKSVQTFAGHSSLQVAMDGYGHLFKSDDHKKAMDAIAADMFGQSR